MYDYADGVSLMVYAVKDGCAASTSVYSAENVRDLKATVSRDQDTYYVSVKTDKPCKVVLVNAGSPRTVSCEYTLEGENVVLTLAGSADVTVSF